MLKAKIKSFCSLHLFLLLAGFICYLCLSFQSLYAQSVAGSPSLDGSGEWRTLQTKHFNIHFPLGQEEYTRQAARLFERVHTKLAPLYPKPFKQYKTNVALVFSGDITQGLATALGINQIILYVEPPSLGTFSRYEQWLELLFIHEYTHILSLQPWRLDTLSLFLVRALIGIPPNHLSPRALVEGLAVWEESKTGVGRINDSLSRMVVRTAVLNDRYPTLSEILSTSHHWPLGQISYLYGGRFINEFARLKGDQAARDYWGLDYIPVAIDAHLSHFGTNANEIYYSLRQRDSNEFIQEIANLQTKGLTPYERLSSDGGLKTFLVYHHNDDRLFYFANPPDKPSGVFSRLADGHTKYIRRQVTNRGIALAKQRRIYSSDYYLYPGFGIRQELYDGNRSYLFGRMAPGRSISYPSLSSDTKQLYFIEKDSSYRYLKTMSLMGDSKEQILLKLPLTALLQYTAVSLDQKYLATIVRSSYKGHFTFLLCNLEAKQEQSCKIILQSKAILTQPCFSYDSQRLIFSSDVDGIYNLYAFVIQEKKILRLTRTTGGFFYPAAAKDALYAIAYFADGYDLVRFSIDTLLQEEANSLFDLGQPNLERLQTPLPSPEGQQPSQNQIDEEFIESTYIAPIHMVPYYTGLFDLGKSVPLTGYILGGLEARDPLGWHTIGANFGILMDNNPEEDLVEGVPEDESISFPALGYYSYNRYNLGLALSYIRDSQFIETSEAYFSYNFISRYLSGQGLLGYRYQEAFERGKTRADKTYLSGPATNLRIGDTHLFYRSISPELGWRLSLEGAHYSAENSLAKTYIDRHLTQREALEYGYVEGGLAVYLPSFFVNHVNYLSVYSYSYFSLTDDDDLNQRHHIHGNLVRNLDENVTEGLSFTAYTYEYRFPLLWASSPIIDSLRSLSLRYLSLSLFYDYGFVRNNPPADSENYFTWAYGLRLGIGLNILYLSLPELQISISNGKNSVTLYSFGFSTTIGEPTQSQSRKTSDLMPYRPSFVHSKKQSGYFRNRSSGGYLE